MDQDLIEALETLQRQIGRGILPHLRALNRAGLLICTQDETPPLGWGLTEAGRREAEALRDA